MVRFRKKKQRNVNFYRKSRYSKYSDQQLIERLTVYTIKIIIIQRRQRFFVSLYFRLVVILTIKITMAGRD